MSSSWSRKIGGDVGAVEEVLHVARWTGDQVVAPWPGVRRSRVLQFFVEGLHFLLGGFQFFVGDLEFLVGGLESPRWWI